MKFRVKKSSSCIRLRICFVLSLFLLFSGVLFSCKEENTPPDCQITSPGSLDTIIIGGQIPVVAQVNDPDGDPVQVTFTVDGQSKSVLDSEPWIYSWNTDGETAGYHTLSCKADDRNGGLHQHAIQVLLQDPAVPPESFFSASVYSGLAPLSVSFTDQSTGNPDEWLWDFGDGATAAEPNPEHVYSSPGVYSVSLEVSNAAASDQYIHSDCITVQENNNIQPPVAFFSAAPVAGTAPLQVTFTAQQQSHPCIFRWDFGDGSTGDGLVYLHIYQETGDYDVTLIVFSEYGADTCVKSSYIHLNEIGEMPVAAFEAEPRLLAVGEPVQFTDRSEGEPDRWFWDFGDGNTDTIPNPSHIYSEAGHYDVSLSVGNNQGVDTQTKTNFIDVKNPPEALFSASPRFGMEPHTTQFTDMSQHSPHSWFWEFGDGQTSTEQNPEHTYETYGNYTVELTVTNVVGSDTKRRYEYIEVSEDPGPVVPCPGTPTLTDIDGNVYNTVQIGIQCWMLENLQVTHYPNGDEIPIVKDDDDWANLLCLPTVDAYCYYNHELTIYGALYTYGAAIGDNWARDNYNGQGVCPEGWRMPFNVDWEILMEHLGGQFEAGGKMKEPDTLHWQSPNTGATNESGFTALPGGTRDRFQTGAFEWQGKAGVWWSASAQSEIHAWDFTLLYNYGTLFSHAYGMSDGFSVRCIKVE